MGRKDLRRKLLVLLLASVVLGSLLALAAGLSGLQFEPGRVLRLGRLPSRGEAPAIPRLDWWMDWLNHIFWGIAALLLLGALIAMILFREYRRELLATALIVALIASWGLLGRRMLWERQSDRPDVIKPLVEELPPRGTQISLEGVKPPPWSSLLLCALILSAAGALAWWLLSRLHRPGEELAHLAELAGEAAADLRAGADLQDTVLRCYREMSELLARRQHIPEERRRVLTPREFEALLRQAGVRDEHITQLSRLFERVRYGGRRATPREERMAIECLEAIERAYGGRAHGYKGRDKDRDEEGKELDVEPEPRPS